MACIVRRMASATACACCNGHGRLQAAGWRAHELQWTLQHFPRGCSKPLPPVTACPRVRRWSRVDDIGGSVANTMPALVLGPWRHCADGRGSTEICHWNWHVFGSKFSSGVAIFLFPAIDSQRAVLPRQPRSRLSAFCSMLGGLRLTMILGVARMAVTVLYRSLCNAGHLRPT